MRASFAGFTIALICSTSAQASLVISTDATQNVSCSDNVCSATAKKAVLNVTDLANLIASSSVTIKSGSQAQDIVFDAPFSWTSSNGLTLDAYRSLIIKQPVADSGSAALTITTRRTGEFSFGKKGHITFLSTSNSLTINGSPYTLVDSISALAMAIGENQGAYVALSKDYDASVDGTYTSTPIAGSFQGHFEGLGNSISNLAIDNKSGGASLFNFIYGLDRHGAASVENIKILKASIIADGGSNAEVGILAGGANGALFLHVLVSGSITAGDNYYVGGMVGLVEDTLVERCAAHVAVEGDKKSYIGGLVGTNYGNRISESYSYGSVKGGEKSYVGGLVGFGSAKVIDSYSMAKVTGGNYAGVGGFVGYSSGNSSQILVHTDFSTGAVAGGIGAFLGGFVGRDTTLGSISDAYWDVTTSGQAQGAGNIDEGGMTGLTTQEFQAGLPSGFDPKIWAQDAEINKGYPYLINNPPTK